VPPLCSRPAQGGREGRAVTGGIQGGGEDPAVSLVQKQAAPGRRIGAAALFTNPPREEERAVPSSGALQGGGEESDRISWSLSEP